MFYELIFNIVQRPVQEGAKVNKSIQQSPTMLGHGSIGLYSRTIVTSDISPGPKLCINYLEVT